MFPIIPAKTENKDGNLRFCHSRAGGNLEMKSNGNLSETTETEQTGFPLLRE
ncbi:hypothetical protein NEIPOLOT_01638 [Neisseria polysaccharea ATCC 43768]|nr:hypothetical protein NEIPOLOT_01638 [Neisseria polysaccharea ATCC 43768]